MIGYFLNRLLNGILVLLGVVTVVFLIFNLKPGDPARMLADQRSSEEALKNIRKDLGLDLSLGERYLLYVNDLSPISVHGTSDSESPFHFDESKYKGKVLLQSSGHAIVVKQPYLRRSYRSRRDVGALLAEAFPSTALLAVTAIFMALVLGLALGTWAALRKGTFIDTLVLGFSAIGMSGPSFFMAVIISWIGGFLWFEAIPVAWVLLVLPSLGFILGFVSLHIEKRKGSVLHRFIGNPGNGFIAGLISAVVLLLIERGLGTDLFSSAIRLPGTGLPTGGSLVDLDPFDGPFINIKHLILPAITLGIRPLSVVVQLTRSSLLDVLSQDHVRTARAKGLTEKQVVVRHGLRNAMIPVLTTISGWFASMLAGAIFVEYVFGWRGMGLEVFTALENEDLPVVMGAVLVFSTIFVLVNLLVDLMYGILDPRVRTS